MRPPVSRPLLAFTLLELLAAIVILSILAAVAIPNFSRALERGRVRDGQSVLAAIFEAERMYRLDENSYGRLREDLVPGRYLTDPDPGNTNTYWDFSTPAFAATTFTARATRTGGGGHHGTTIEVDQAFNGRAFGGNHLLRDQ